MTSRRAAAAQTEVPDDERVGPGLETTLQGVVARARRRGAECSVQARQHGVSYRRWRVWSSLLGVVTAIGSAVAAALLLLGETGGAQAVVGGLLALVAAVCATANTAVVQTRVEEHRMARAVFLNLHTRYVLLGDLPLRDLVTARSQLEDIERSHAELEAETPPADGRTARPSATDVPAPVEPDPVAPPDRPTESIPAARLRPPAVPRVPVQPESRPEA